MKKIDKEKNHTEFSKYYVDIEYNRNKGKIKTIINGEYKVLNITCDIILHSRGENISQDNLIALEMKKSTGSDLEKNKDRDRLKALTKDTFDDVWSYDGKTLPEHVCRYALGVFYEINLSKKEVYIEYYRKGQVVKKQSMNF